MSKQKDENLALYYSPTCFFCTLVRQTISKSGLTVEMKDIQRSKAFRDELVSGGGKPQVPCLQIESDTGAITWMYESAVIINYLQQR